MRHIDPEMWSIRCFLAVADERHFGRAARRLHISQPSVSRSVRSLEQTLGVELFVRNSRNVRLTPAGLSFRAHVPRALDELAQAVRLARDAAASSDPNLTVAYLPSARPLVVEAAAAFRARFDRVHLTLTESLSESQYARLLDGSVDISVVRGRRSDPRLIARMLTSSTLCVALPRGHPLAAAPELEYGDLRHESFVLWPRAESPESFDRIILECQLAGFESLVVAESGDAQTVASLVAAGWGVSILGSSLRGLLDTDIVLVPLRGEAEPLSVLWRTGNDSRACLDFVDLLIERAHRTRTPAGSGTSTGAG